MRKALEKNEIELNNENQCWSEIQEVLKKYNCKMTGHGETCDDEGNDYYVSANDFWVESVDYIARNKEHTELTIKQEKEAKLRQAKDKYKELIKTYPHFEDLELIQVGKNQESYFWFKGLKVNKKLAHGPILHWNPNRYWQFSSYGESYHGVHLHVDDKSEWAGTKGEPFFVALAWRPNGENPKDTQNVKWFGFKKNTPIYVYQDMIATCVMLTTLLKEGVLYFE